MRGFTRLSVLIDTETADALSALADRRDGTITDAVRSAVLIYKALADELAKGKRVAILSANGKRMQEWVLPPYEANQ